MSQHNQVYASGGFQPRAFRQRRDRDLLPDFLAYDLTPISLAVNPLPDNLPVEITLLGTWVGPCGSSSSHTREISAWSVRLQSGLRVPAYSFGGTYNICQHHGFKAFQGSK